MEDLQGRTIEYLRLSVTDRCNCRCLYCMEPQGVPMLSHSAVLRYEELADIARAAVRCGVRKIRLTGGEPLVRRGLPQLCRMLRAIPGVEELALTTNGLLLPRLAAELRAAGVDRLNISLDSLDPEVYRRLTRGASLDDALAGLDAARDAGFTGTKLNTVLIGGVNDGEIAALAALSRTRPEIAAVRFIELMPMGPCAHWPAARFLPADAVLAALPDLRFAGQDGVAECYRAPDGTTVGLIRPLSHKFCTGCSRIRVTSDGMLKPCLHSAAELPLRGLTGPALEQAIRQGIRQKPAEHHLGTDLPSESARDMNEIGG